MDNYGRHVLEGALAGLITGGLLAFVTLELISVGALDHIIEEIIEAMLKGKIPPEELERAVRSAKEVVRMAWGLAPVVNILQHLLIGSLFGLLKGALRLKAGLGEIASAVLTGLIYTIVLGVLPIIALSALVPIYRYGEILIMSISPGAVYTASVLVVSAIRGPWTKIIRAEPKAT